MTRFWTLFILGVIYMLFFLCFLGLIGSALYGLWSLACFLLV